MQWATGSSRVVGGTLRRVRPAPPTRLGLVRQARQINRLLAQRYPDAHCELDFESPWQLLVATVLSAQTTDARVNEVTPRLFARYPSPLALAGADPGQVEEIVRPTGFYRAKTRSVIGLAGALVERHDGVVPGTLEQLVTLPGVGRKTANVVLGDAFGVPGITVDTHFGRLARRFAWTSSHDPVEVERDVAGLFPRRDWTPLSHRLIWHGRRTCHARRPACGACNLTKLCPSYGIGEVDPARATTLLRYELDPRRAAETVAGQS